MLDKEIVLASASPRRLELLKQIGLEFTVCPAHVNETVDKHLEAQDIVKKLSMDKALKVAESLKGDFIVIGSDTVVWCDEILGKPKSKEQAFDMLSKLSGRWHKVYTGICVVDSEGKKTVDYEVTDVKIRKLEVNEINGYINTKEPMDKAGGYGIQGIGALLVERIEGCYFNVVGLPLTKFANILGKYGVNQLENQEGRL